MNRPPKKPQAIGHFAGTNSEPTAEKLVDEVLAGFLQLVDEGKAPDPEQLIAKHPHLESELRAFFEGEQLFRQSTLSVVGGELPTSIATLPSGRPSLEFGDYVFLGEIARGGMGIVYRALQKSLDRTVAVKMILSSGLATKRQIDRFYEEAKAAAQLVHTSIVRVLEVGQHEGHHYYSMEYISGGSLADRLSAGPVPPKQAAKWIRCVADAVHYAHQHGVLHRDIKPANVLLTDDDRPMLSDFGLAKRLRDDSGLTQTGEILGTPSFMAPEQASKDQKSTGSWSDIYSLGALLYALITGRPPIHAQTPQAALVALANERPIPPRKIDSKIHTDLETICLKCLEKHPRDRYASAKEMSEDLDRFLSGRPINARPVAWPNRIARWVGRNPTATALLTISIFVLAVAPVTAHYFIEFDRQLSTNQQEKNRLILDTEQAEMRMNSAEQQLNLLSDRLSSSEKANQLAQVDATAQADFTARLTYVQRLNQAYEAWQSGDAERTRRLLEQSRPEEGETDQRGFAWFHLYKKVNQFEREFDFESGVLDSKVSVDGSRLAVLDGSRKLSLFDLGNGKEVTDSTAEPTAIFGRSPLKKGIEFSPDSSMLAIALSESESTTNDQRKIGLLDARDGSLRRFLEQNNSREFTKVVFLPDGKTVVGLHEAWVSMAAWTVADGTMLYELETKDNSLLDSVMSPDGSMLGTLTIAESGNTWLRIRDPMSGDEIHAAKLPGRHFHGSLKFSPDGQRLVASVMDGDEVSTSYLAIWDTQDWQQSGSIDITSQEFFFSPDSANLAIGELSSTGRFTGGLTVKLFDVHSLELVNEVVREGKRGFFMGYSGDGSSLLTISGRSFRNSQLKEWDVNSGQILQKHNVAVETTTNLLPGGQTLLKEVSTPNLSKVIAGDQTRKVRLWMMGRQAEHTEFPTNGEFESSIAFTADNKHLLVARANESRVMNLASRQVQKIPAGKNRTAQLAHQRLAFLSADGQLKVLNLGTGKDEIAVLTESGIQLSDKVNGIWSSADGEVLFIAASGKLFRGMVDGNSIRLSRIIRAFNPNRQIVVSKTGARVAVLTPIQGQQEVAVYSGMDGTLFARFNTIISQFNDTICDFLNDRFLICRQLGLPVEVWDLAKIEKATTLEDSASAQLTSDIAGSPDGQIMAVSDSLGTVQLWDFQTSNLLASLEMDEIVHRITFSPDGTMLAALCADGVVRILQSSHSTE